jgi:hypothetical protein
MMWSAMPVRNISRLDLDQLFPHRFAIGRFIGSEVEWFADGNSIGTIAQGATSTNWGCVVLKRDELDDFQIWDLKTGIERRDAARIQIVHTMEATN